ncbi:hypothetical protein [Flavobacterium terrae]|nr:hypothetical protein [Flavobacterium terrae]
MKNFKNFLLILIVMGTSLYGQKKTYDVVSFTLPKEWNQSQNEGGIQLSTSDKNDGTYALVVITKATLSNESVLESFDNEWEKLLEGTVKIDGKPIKKPKTNKNGWDIISGSANYTDGNNKGLATLLTAAGGGQKVSVVLMTNSKKYQDDLISFLNSLEIKKVDNVITKPNTNVNTNQNSIVGLWTDYILETSGVSFNGNPQYTSGYLRKEYTFYKDGTYIFRNKQWLTKAKNISFVYESGTYSVMGNKIIITPKKGEEGWWSKKSNNTKLWGSVVSISKSKLEPKTYFFEIKYFSGSNSSSLILKSNKTDEVLGNYKYREDNTSIIDNPPGFKKT